MNKQEAIKEIDGYAVISTFVPKSTEVIKIEKAKEIISQIHEPQKVVVPKHIADKIKYCKDTEGYGLFHAMDYCYQYEDSADWLECNEETFARAWFFGYEIEQEKLYTVEIPNNGGFIVLAYINQTIKLADSNKHLPGKFTKESIEYAGFGWVFDCNSVKVVEVE
ncbi:TPA: DUF1642 domain-containing protein [Streptococcus suis]|nr:DUF1642 domain-containing protein [Streptococcus suis]